MSNHPNRESPDVINAAVGILIGDARSGYDKADRNGRKNIRDRYYREIFAHHGATDEIASSPKHLAEWYVRQFWTYE